MAEAGAVDDETISRVVDLLAETPGLAEALEMDHYIVRDIARRFHGSNPSLSEKQIALVFKLQREAEERAVERAEQALPGHGGLQCGMCRNRHPAEGASVEQRRVTSGDNVIQASRPCHRGDTAPS